MRRCQAVAAIVCMVLAVLTAVVVLLVADRIGPGFTAMLLVGGSLLAVAAGNFAHDRTHRDADHDV